MGPYRVASPPAPPPPGPRVRLRDLVQVQPKLARACAAWCAITVGIALGPGTVLIRNGIVWLYPVAVSLSLAATLAYAGMFACDLPQRARALRWYARLPRDRRTW